MVTYGKFGTRLGKSKWSCMYTWQLVQNVDLLMSSGLRSFRKCGSYDLTLIPKQGFISTWVHCVML